MLAPASYGQEVKARATSASHRSAWLCAHIKEASHGEIQENRFTRDRCFSFIFFFKNGCLVYSPLCVVSMIHRIFQAAVDLTLICCVIYVCGNVRDVGIYLCVKPRQPSLQGAKSQLLILRRGGFLIPSLSRPPESSLRWRAKKTKQNKTANLGN